MPMDEVVKCANSNVKVGKTNLYAEASLSQSNGISVLTMSLYLEDFDISFADGGDNYFATIGDRLAWSLMNDGPEDGPKIIPSLGASLVPKTAGDKIQLGTINAAGVVSINGISFKTQHWVGSQVLIRASPVGDATEGFNMRAATIIDYGDNEFKIDTPMKTIMGDATYADGVQFLVPFAVQPQYFYCTSRAAIPWGNGVKVILVYENWMGARERIMVERSARDMRVSYDKDNVWGRVNDAWAWEDAGGANKDIVRQRSKLMTVEEFSEVRSIHFPAQSIGSAWTKIKEIAGCIGAVNKFPFMDEIGARWQILPPDLIHIGDTQRVLVNLLFRKSPILDKPGNAEALRGDPWWPIAGYMANDGRQVSDEFNAPRWKYDSITKQTAGLPSIESGVGPNPSTDAEEWISNGWARLKTYPDIDFNKFLKFVDYVDPPSAREVYLNSNKLWTKLEMTVVPAPPEPEE